MATATLLNDQLDRLASFEPTTFPVLSLYLDTRANEHGRDSFEVFLRQELTQKAASFPKRSSDRESFDKDAERIRHWVSTELKPSSNGAAIFACMGAGLFETIQLEVPVGESRLYISHAPHLYHLARIQDQYPRYVAVVADTNSARIFVFGLRTVETATTIANPKSKRVHAGGWSQARYQRHVENFREQHVKEVMDVLERIVRDEKIEKVVFAGDDVLTSYLREQMTPVISERFVDILKLDMTTPEHEVLNATLDAIRQKDGDEDRDKVEAMLGAWRGGGLGVAGFDEVMRALANGQVDELFVTESIEQEHPEAEPVDAAVLPHLEVIRDGDAAEQQVFVADELVTRARQTGAKVTIVEDRTLLEGVAGVGATLRFRL
jgi:peptide chain release factor subunit 1